jgi:hypothetical protein
MATIHKMILRLAAKAIRMIKMVAFPRTWIEGVGMATVIEFYVPIRFRKTMKWVPTLDRGKIIEFCPQTRKSA